MPVILTEISGHRLFFMLRQGKLVLHLVQGFLLIAFEADQQMPVFFPDHVHGLAVDMQGICSHDCFFDVRG